MHNILQKTNKNPTEIPTTIPTTHGGDPGISSWLRPPPPGISSRLRPPSPGIFWLRSPPGPKSAVRPGPGGDISGCAPPRPARNVHSELRLDVVSQTVRQSDSQSDSQSGDGRGIKPGFAGNNNGASLFLFVVRLGSSFSDAIDFKALR